VLAETFTLGEEGGGGGDTAEKQRTQVQEGEGWANVWNLECQAVVAIRSAKWTTYIWGYERAMC
jgi:hypothetical protein